MEYEVSQVSLKKHLDWEMCRIDEVVMLPFEYFSVWPSSFTTIISVIFVYSVNYLIAFWV